MMNDEQVWANVFWLGTSVILVAAHWMVGWLDHMNPRTTRRWQDAWRRALARGRTAASLRSDWVRGIRVSAATTAVAGAGLMALVVGDLLPRALATPEAPVAMAALVAFATVGAGFLLLTGVALLRLLPHPPAIVPGADA